MVVKQQRLLLLSCQTHVKDIHFCLLLKTNMEHSIKHACWCSTLLSWNSLEKKDGKNKMCTCAPESNK